jgi:hypothetical protein
VVGHKAVSVAAEQGPLPPIKLAALNIKTVPDSTDKAQEIVAVSVLHTTMQVDRPIDLSKWRSATAIRRFSVLSPPHGAQCPSGLQSLVKVRIPAAEVEALSACNSAAACAS